MLSETVIQQRLDSIRAKLDSINVRSQLSSEPRTEVKTGATFTFEPQSLRKAFRNDSASTSIYYPMTHRAPMDDRSKDRIIQSLTEELEMCNQLIQQSNKPAFPTQYSEAEVEALRREVRELREANSLCEADLFALQKEKVNWLQSLDELKRQLFKRENDYELLYQEKIKLEQQQPYRSTLHTERRGSLDSTVKPEKSSRRHSSIDVPGRFQVTLSKATKIIHELLQELKLASPNLLTSKVKALSKVASTTKYQLEFIESIKKIAADHLGCAKNSSLKDVLLKVADAAKATQKGTKTSRGMLKALAKQVGAKTPEALPRVVSRLLAHSELLTTLSEKLKIVLNLGPRAELTHIEHALNKRL